MVTDPVGAGLDGPAGPRSDLPIPHPSPSTERTSAAPVSGDHAIQPNHPAHPGWIASRHVHGATLGCPPIRSRVVCPDRSEQFAPGCSAPRDSSSDQDPTERGTLSPIRSGRISIWLPRTMGLRVPSPMTRRASYALLQEDLDPTARPLPVQVSQLDGSSRRSAGFR